MVVSIPFRSVVQSSTLPNVFGNVDWTHGEAHMWEKHGVSSVEADEALDDPNRVVIDPDYASVSGRSVRIIGYSDTFGELLTVIVVAAGGEEFGVNGWMANPKDRLIYSTQGQRP